MVKRAILQRMKSAKYLYYIPPSLLIMLGFILFSCSTSSPLNPLNSLAPPLGLKAEPSPQGKGILLTFYAANDEDDFDGFNIYISEKENVADTAEGTRPLLPEGLAPSINSSPDDFDTNKLRSCTVYYRNNEFAPLARGVTYFFILRSHSSKGHVSAPSNEASAFAP